MAVTSGQTAGGGPPTSGSYSSWQQEVLALIGAPDTTANHLALSWWAASEGTDWNRNNWLATTLKTDPQGNQIPTAGIIAPNGGNPVPAYPTSDIGAHATAWTIQAYPAIVGAFRNGNDLAGVYRAINSSSWCSGCQGGRYPVQLYQAVSKEPNIGPEAINLSPEQTAQRVQQLAQRGSCRTMVHVPIPGIPDFCADKILAIGLMAAGSLVGLVGVGFLLSGIGRNSLGRQLTRALPGGSAPQRAPAARPFRENEAPASSAARRVHQTRERGRKQADLRAAREVGARRAAEDAEYRRQAEFERAGDKT